MKMPHEGTMVSGPPFLPVSNENVGVAVGGGGNTGKRKRRPAGTPDPDAEVVALSPKTLLESDRYVCEICNQGFQRDQNLQMHRRRHKVPWKLLKRETPEVRKRVFVCPEPSCLHHHPSHALGDLVGIKKHFRRKHSDHKQWACARCSKAYAVHSDYKAHLKTCGTRGHSCDCGRVFSRVESFIEHQDICTAGRPPPPPWLALPVRYQTTPNIASELQLLPARDPPTEDTELNLSIDAAARAADDKKAADEARRVARKQVEMAEEEFVKARRIRQEARLELSKAQAMRHRAVQQINHTLLQITCFSCKQQLPAVAGDGDGHGG